MNRYSLMAPGRLTSLFYPIAHTESVSILTRLTAMIRSQLQGVRVRWGSVISFPLGQDVLGAGLEERIPAMKNPFGAFFGLSFSVAFSFQTIQQTIREHRALNTVGGHQGPGAIRE